jgi:HAMP domain-containing protein
LNEAKPRPGFSSLRIRLVGTVFLAIAPAAAFLYFTRLPWTGFAIGLLSLFAAWFGGERFVLRHLHRINEVVKRLSSGDLSSRTGLGDGPDELGQLARAFDSMAANLEDRIKKQELAEQTLLSRALQQSAVAALGQLALTTGDLLALSNQAVLLISQTLDIEFCGVFEVVPGGKSMRMQAGLGWRPDAIGRAVIGADKGSLAGQTIITGEPSVFANVQAEARFVPEPLLVDHKVISGVSLPIGARQKTYGLLGVYSIRERSFSGDDLQFLMAMANVLALAVERRGVEGRMKKLAELAQSNPTPAVELAADGTMTYFNQAAIRLAKVLGQGHPGDDFVPRDIRRIAQVCLATGESKSNVEARQGERMLSWSLHPLPANQVVHCYVADITESLQMEQQLRELQKTATPGA